ncbi:dethiobiotin synthase [Kushneria phosphatilytica]|uniref:ATP-dependent dethiobiotin synthetase BioD n=1 Tax=Kushneria phosphatilytica TaxID=657387 RepID=A0A1S1NL87_9GAMM|nr:dethiobiotin synthase [Kushneria phosphatilytica]OHV07526.1 dethiobiotin synthase [Kushneria phosphatilytica]QEL10010.1 dethiobiotin synthase [Kushneria phosphatilytica]
MKRAFFVTGTDTDAGKTVIAAGLLAAARRRGLSTAAGKPVASGCTRTPHGLRNTDALALQRECRPELAYEMINPVALEPAIAPHIAAREVGIELTVSALAAPMRTLLARQADLTLIEGAGGWRVPLNEHESLCELPHALALPVVLVVGVRLGAISHARLTLEAIERDGLRVAGWVANVIEGDTARLAENLDTLKHWLGLDRDHAMGRAPCLGVVPRLADPEPERVADYLDIDELMDWA